MTRQLRKQIIIGSLAPGARLMQDQLAAQMGVSRQPIREALRRLESEGLVRNFANRGAIVRHFSDEEIRENYTLREVLESLAARHAAVMITGADLRKLQIANVALADAINSGDAGTAMDLNFQIHRTIHEASGLETLVRFMDQLWVGLTVMTPLFVPGSADQSVLEHATVISELAERSPRGAASAMRKHVRRGDAEYFEWAKGRAPTSSAAAPDGWAE